MKSANSETRAGVGPSAFEKSCSEFGIGRLGDRDKSGQYTLRIPSDFQTSSRRKEIQQPNINHEGRYDGGDSLAMHKKEDFPKVRGET